jgi:activator of Hsp90 ATPase-like protein
MNAWWGYRTDEPSAGTAKGQWLDVYEPRAGGRIQMSVNWDGTQVSFGGAIAIFEPNLRTFENDWIPNRGWLSPTSITLRLTPALGGTLVELVHHHFERTGGDVSATHADYEEGWGMTQLSALKRIVDAAASRASR